MVGERHLPHGHRARRHRRRSSTGRVTRHEARCSSSSSRSRCRRRRSRAASQLQQGEQLYGRYCVDLPRPERGRAGRRREPRRRRAGARPGRAAGLGPPLRGVGALAADFYLAHRLHAAEARRHAAAPVARCCSAPREIDALIAYVASLGKGPAIPRPHPERGNLSAGLQLFTEHCAGCHQIVGRGRLRDRRRAAAARRRDADADRRGGAHRAVRDAAFSTHADLATRELDSIIRYVAVHEASGRPRRLVARPHRPDPGGARDLVLRDDGARRASAC